MTLDFYTLHQLVVLALWILICLFYWQYRECIAMRRNKKVLEDKNEDLGCFAYAAAHDLKAPLRTIRQLSNRIEADRNGNLSPGQKEMMDLLRQRAGRMERLIDDLLAYWQAGQKNDNLDNYPTDSGALARDTLRILSPSPGFHIYVESELASFPVCHLPLQQVFLNLIGNAIKHHEGDSGTIRLSGTRSPEGYQFCVEDDGPGIDPAYHAQVFKMFATLKSRDDVEGSGLGLCLVERIVTRMGGRIWLADSSLGGLAVHFTWPARQPC